MGTEVADGEGDGVPDGSHDSSGRARMTVAEAARALGISDSAVRKRVKRGKLEHERTPDGRVFVYLDDAATSASGRDGSRGVGNLKDQVEHLRGELDREREANREGGRIIAGLEERIAELEASQKATAAPEGREAAPPTAGSDEGGQEPLRAHKVAEYFKNEAIWAQFFITAAASMVAVAILVISVSEGRVLVAGLAGVLANLSVVAFLFHLWLFRFGKDRIFRLGRDRNAENEDSR
jgi:excisionase family DNA binding protein